MRIAAEAPLIDRNLSWIRNPDGAFGAWDRWVASTGVPVHEGYFVPDMRTIELGWWAERRCNAAFLKLAGFDGICEARVTEIPPGRTMPPLKVAVDEAVYVVGGRGLTTIWNEATEKKVSFEWQENSLFLLPRHHYHQLSNVQGERPARLFHYSYLPLIMVGIPDPGYFFNGPFVPPADAADLAGLYSEAKRGSPYSGDGGRGNTWMGNFFPDMGAWDKLEAGGNRGAGARHVGICFPGSPITGHMAYFGSRTYKKAHRHEPGDAIVIPTGEGFSVLWPEGREKIFVPWQERSVFVPPNQWWHQHFNVGPTPARYLAFHVIPTLLTYSNQAESVARNQIEYPNEDPWIRQTFEAELAKRRLTSLMPDDAYRDLDYEWKAVEL
jgi:hypothetical protein